MSLQIELNGFIIKPEPIGFMVWKISETKKGKERISNIKYPPSLTHCLVYIRDNEIAKMSKAKVRNLNEYIEELKKIDYDIVDKMNDVVRQFAEKCQAHSEEINENNKKLIDEFTKKNLKK